LCLACHEHHLYNYDTGSFVCLPINGKNDSHELPFLYTEKILKLYNRWIYNHIPKNKPIYCSQPPFHKRAVNTTDTSCCTKRLLSIFCSKKTPNFMKKIIYCVSITL
jgi:hypothetical protein